MLFLLLGFPRGSWINKNIFNPLTRALCITGHIRTWFGIRMFPSTLTPFSEWTPALHGNSLQWTFSFISAAVHCDTCCVDVETFGAFWYFLVLLVGTSLHFLVHCSATKWTEGAACCIEVEDETLVHCDTLWHFFVLVGTCWLGLGDINTQWNKLS